MVDLPAVAELVEGRNRDQAKKSYSEFTNLTPQFRISVYRDVQTGRLKIHGRGKCSRAAFPRFT